MVAVICLVVGVVALAGGLLLAVQVRGGRAQARRAARRVDAVADQAMADMARRTADRRRSSGYSQSFHQGDRWPY
jgi:hypothetical protein